MSVWDWGKMTWCKVLKEGVWKKKLLCKIKWWDRWQFLVKCNFDIAYFYMLTDIKRCTVMSAFNNAASSITYSLMCENKCSIWLIWLLQIKDCRSQKCTENWNRTRVVLLTLSYLLIALSTSMVTRTDRAMVMGLGCLNILQGIPGNIRGSAGHWPWCVWMKQMAG